MQLIRSVLYSWIALLAPFFCLLPLPLTQLKKYIFLKNWIPLFFIFALIYFLNPCLGEDDVVHPPTASWNIYLRGSVRDLAHVQNRRVSAHAWDPPIDLADTPWHVCACVGFLSKMAAWEQRSETLWWKEKKMVVVKKKKKKVSLLYNRA